MDMMPVSADVRVVYGLRDRRTAQTSGRSGLSEESGGGTGEAGCVSQAYTANANKRSYTREA
eukprot:4884990-Pleurochrysis_carterae.AAC.1